MGRIGREKKRKERLSGWKSGWKGRECGRFVERLPFRDYTSLSVLCC